MVFILTVFEIILNRFTFFVGSQRPDPTVAEIYEKRKFIRKRRKRDWGDFGKIKEKSTEEDIDKKRKEKEEEENLRRIARNRSEGEDFDWDYPGPEIKPGK